jgi:pseudaminic acid synthase
MNVAQLPAEAGERAIAPIRIAGRPIGPGEPTYVIAEISANHRQDFEEARRLVEAAARTGADAVKLQTYTPDTITIDSSAPPFRHREGSLWAGTTLYELYRNAFMPWEWTGELKRIAEAQGVACFSSPFDPSAVDFLEALDVPAYKVASFEIVDLPLIRRMAATGKPLIISSGMATLDEIVEAVDAARAGGATEIAVLKCTSAYPASPDDANLGAIAELMAKLQIPIGLSDHTTGIAVPVAAVALGASIVEKHVILDRTRPSADEPFSLPVDEFAAMVDAVRVAERAIAGRAIGPTPAEEESRRFRRSLFVVHDVAAGEILTAQSVRSIRPAGGLHPRYFDMVLGRRTVHGIARGTPLSWDLIEGAPPEP